MTKYNFLRRPSQKRAIKQHIAQTQRSFIRGVLFLLVLTLGIIFIFGDHGVLQLYKLKKEKAEIQKHISLLREKRELLFSEKNRLENDLQYIERLAREKYRMAKSGEEVFKVIPNSKD
mgnify:CR=1 FL=1|tara:strand:+ start:86 stop:439 length:354 start_codon:yes stop_codon:yes gene_type:complete